MKPIDVRRAVLSVFFLHDGGPLTIDQVVKDTKRLAGLDTTKFSTSTRWRCLHWQRVVEWRRRTLRPPLP